MPTVGQHGAVVTRSASPSLLRSLVPVGAIALIAALAGCTPPDDEARVLSGCASSVSAAADAVEVADQVRLLDQALVRCRSLDALTVELALHPGLIGYSPRTFVEIRCSRVDDPATMRSPACSEVAAPTTTVTATTVVQLSFVGETLDGRPIEISAADGVQFVGDIPAEIQRTVDIAIESGCDGLLERRDRWVAQVSPTPGGDLASVYAQHAQNVADYVGCELPPIGG